MRRIVAVIVSLVTLLPCTMVLADPPLGSTNLEPGLVGRDDVIFFEDFESPDWYTHWNLSTPPDNCSLVTNPVFDGASALRVHVAAGEHYGVSLSFNFTDQGLAEPEEIYFRYYLYFGGNWYRDGGEVGKLPGFGGTYGVAGWGGRPSHGDDGWSARMMNRDCVDDVLVGYYCYHADMAGTYGDHLPWEIDSLGYLERERWYCIECYAKMNTITGGAGNNDGVLRGWVDGKLAFEKTDIRFRDVDTLKIETIWFNIYVGGTWTAPQDMDVYFDNVVIAQNPIGVCQRYIPYPMSRDRGCGSCAVADAQGENSAARAAGWFAFLAVLFLLLRAACRRRAAGDSTAGTSD